MRRTAKPDAREPLVATIGQRNRAHVKWPAVWREEIATATMFLTRLPVGRFASGDPPVLSRATRWFPLVGLQVGALLALTLAMLVLMLPTSAAVVGTLIVGVLLTGGFHEDGLADVADSAGAFGIDAKLVIMRDSRVGTYGALALILLVLAKYVLLVEMLQRFSLTRCAFVLVAAHVASRWSSVWLMAQVPYARPEAANRVVADGVTARRLLEASVVAAGCLVIAGLLSQAAPIELALSLLAIAAAAIVVPVVAGWRFRRTLGGITGDCLGAVNQLVEVAVLIVVVALDHRLSTGG